MISSLSFIFIEMCKEEGILHFVICPYHPYHSHLTLPMIPLFEKITSGIKYNSTSSSCKYISTVTGQVEETMDSEYFLRHLKEPARLTSAVSTALTQSCTHFLEIGSHPLNCTMVQDMLEDYSDKHKYVLLESLRRKQDDSLSLLNTLGQLFSLGYGVQLVEK
jgi:acyl transferase domain-containing protein